MSKTLDQWVTFLTSRMDVARPRVDRLRGYTNGNAPLPEMGPNLRKSWEAFQRRALANAGALIVDTLVERLIPNGILVGESPDGPRAVRARRIWRDNRLDVAFKDAARDAFTVGTGYLLVTRDDNGEAVITREMPEQLYAEPDPVRPWKALAAVKVWRSVSEGADHMIVWVDGVKATYSRSVYNERNQLICRVQGRWALDGLDVYDGDPPIVLLGNKDGMGEFEAHTGLIDRINTGILYRLVTMAMQTYRQRALKTITPVSAMLPDAANQSASGAEQPMQQLVFKAQDRILRFKPALAVMLVKALQVEGESLAGDTVEVKFAPPATVTMTERYAAAAQAKAAGEALETIQENILGYSPEQIAQDKQRRAEEQLALALNLTTQPPPTTSEEMQPIGNADTPGLPSRRTV